MDRTGQIIRRGALPLLLAACAACAGREGLVEPQSVAGSL